MKVSNQRKLKKYHQWVWILNLNRRGDLSFETEVIRERGFSNLAVMHVCAMSRRNIPGLTWSVFSRLTGVNRLGSNNVVWCFIIVEKLKINYMYLWKRINYKFMFITAALWYWSISACIMNHDWAKMIYTADSFSLITCNCSVLT